MSILDDYITEAGLAEELDRNVATVIRWKKKNICPAYTIGKTIYWRLEAVRSYNENVYLLHRNDLDANPVTHKGFLY